MFPTMPGTPGVEAQRRAATQQRRCPGEVISRLGMRLFCCLKSTRAGCVSSELRTRPERTQGTMTTERRHKGISRRKFLKASAGTAALLAAARAQLPSGAFAQAAGPEV